MHFGADRACKRTRRGVVGPHAGVPLGQIFRDRQRIPDNRLAVMQRGHVARRRVRQVRRIRADALQLDDHFVERRTGELRGEPAAQ